MSHGAAIDLSVCLSLLRSQRDDDVGGDEAVGLRLKLSSHRTPPEPEARLLQRCPTPTGNRDVDGGTGSGLPCGYSIVTRACVDY